MSKEEKRNISVLLLDDDESFLKISKQCLLLQGDFEIDTAKSYEEALDKLNRTNHDVIVFDLPKSRKNDFEFLKRLEDNGITTPYVLFTFEDGEELAIMAQKMGAKGCVGKFGDPDVVYSTLKNCIIATTRTT